MVPAWLKTRVKVHIGRRVPSPPWPSPSQPLAQRKLPSGRTRCASCARVGPGHRVADVDREVLRHEGELRGGLDVEGRRVRGRRQGERESEPKAVPIAVARAISGGRDAERVQRMVYPSRIVTSLPGESTARGFGFNSHEGAGAGRLEHHRGPRAETWCSAGRAAARGSYRWPEGLEGERFGGPEMPSAARSSWAFIILPSRITSST